MFKRYSKNPIISPKDIISSHPEMIDISSVFNPGGIQFGNKILLLLRVQNRGRETLTVKATSDDGVHFSIDDQPIQPIHNTPVRLARRWRCTGQHHHL